MKDLSNATLPSGKHEFKWNLDSNNGKRVTRGIYLCVLVTDNQKVTSKIIVE